MKTENFDSKNTQTYLDVTSKFPKPTKTVNMSASVFTTLMDKYISEQVAQGIKKARKAVQRKPDPTRALIKAIKKVQAKTNLPFDQAMELVGEEQPEIIENYYASKRA